MRIITLLFLLTIIQSAECYSQTGRSSDTYSRLIELYMETGQVSIYTDSLIIENYHKHLLQNSKSKGIPGYRIRIFSESGIGAKDRQKRVRAEFLSLYHDVDAYYSYDGLNFKVYVGDCRTRSDAAKLFEKIKTHFPNAIIVRENINLQ